MTLTKDIASKLSVAFVAVAMIFTMFAPAAQAQATDDLQQMINDLLAQVASLQSQLGQGDTAAAGPAGVCPYTWTRSLSTGSTGADVMKLQQLLNSDADTRVAAAGSIGSAGMETEYYGPATAAAVSKMQVKYRADVLSPAGLVNPTGYFGPSSRAKANMLCTSAPVVDNGGDDMDDTDDMDDSDDSDDSDDGDLSGGEADVNSLEGSDEEDEVAEGEEDVAVHNVEFDVEDADVMLKRVDVTLDGTVTNGTDGEQDPWDAFDEISLWVDGDKIASEDVTDEDDWDENTGEEFVFRLSGLDTIFREDTTGEIIIAVSAASGVDVDGDAGDDDWDIFVDTDGLRFVDSEGIDITEGPGSADASTFELIEEGENDDLDLESSDEDPDADTFALDEDDETEVMIFAFDLSADDSDNDISLNDITVGVVVGGTEGTSLNAFVDDFRLEVDGESFDAESYTGSGVGAEILFDVDGDVEIPADETVTAMLYANFDDVASSFTTATIVASTSASDIDSEGADDVTADGSTDLGGNTHTLRLAGVDVELVSEDTDSDENNDATAADDEGVFTLEFDVTAFGDDLYLPFGSSRTATATDGVTWEILDDNGSVVSTGTTTPSLDVEDSGSEETNSYKVDEGSTETFTLEVRFDPASSGSYKLRLNSVNFNTTDSASSATVQDVTGLDIDTGKLTISS